MEVHEFRDRVVTFALIAIVGSLIYVPWAIVLGSAATAYHMTAYGWLWAPPWGPGPQVTILWGHVLLQVLAIVAAAALGIYLAPTLAPYFRTNHKGQGG